MENENLEKTEIPISTRVMVVGSGLVASVAAQELAEIGHEVIFCSSEENITGNSHFWGSREDIPVDPESIIKEMEDDFRIYIMSPAEILELRGSPGKFQVSVRVNGGIAQEKEVGAVILANEPLLTTSFEAWGVSVSEKIRSLSWLESTLSDSINSFLSQDLSLKFVFLCGFTHHSNPFSQRRAVEAALKLTSKRENQVFFITDHFKVAHTGMERLTRKARESGVLFVKLFGTRPEIKSEGDKVIFSCYDEALGEKVRLLPDFLILEEDYNASEETAILADRLGINLDRSGFFQCDNIYNHPIYTNRTGILVVGAAKGPISLEEGIEEAKSAAMEIHQFLGERDQVVAEKRLLFEEGKCGRCLTCYRSCPHRAISCLEGRPMFYDLACKACGICASGCPMDAIQIACFSDTEIKSQIENVCQAKPGQKKGDIVHLIAFCCENSAFESARLAALKGFVSPQGLELVKVPCAGRVDLDYLLKAFEFGADGVMMLGCHHESCKSVTGNSLAKRRVEIIGEALGEVGLERERLFFRSLAPGMSSEFIKIAKEMEEIVRGLGESPVGMHRREKDINVIYG